MTSSRLQALTEEKIAETAKVSNSYIDFTPEKSACNCPSEVKE
jgi:hypothetical protein